MPTESGEPLAPQYSSSRISKTNIMVPLSGDEFNSCTNELFTYSGNIHIVQDSVMTSDTTARGRFRVNSARLQGVTDTGTRYNFILHQSAVSNYVLTPPFAFTTTFSVRTASVSAGAGDNQHTLFILTFVWDGSNGSTVIDSSMSCIG